MSVYKSQSIESIYSIAAVKRDAEGNWGSIFRALCPNFSEAMRVGHRKHVAHPLNAEWKKAFRLKQDWETHGGAFENPDVFRDGIGNVAWQNNCSQSEALRMIRDHLDGIHVTPRAYTENPTQKKQRLEREAEALRQENANKAYVLNKVSSELLKAPGTPVQTYLQTRGVLEGEVPSCLAYHPSMYYKDDDGNRNDQPAMIGIVRDVTGKPVSMHRTFLSRDGRSKSSEVEDAKMQLPSPHELSGAAIKLHQPVRGVIGVAEGIETALAVHKGFRMPMWSTMNANLLAQVEFPPEVHTVVIWADRDRSATGQNKAIELQTRLTLMGINAIIMMPERSLGREDKSVDWADVLVNDAEYFKTSSKIADLRTYIVHQVKKNQA